MFGLSFKGFLFFFSEVFFFLRALKKCFRRCFFFNFLKVVFLSFSFERFFFQRHFFSRSVFFSRSFFLWFFGSECFFCLRNVFVFLHRFFFRRDVFSFSKVFPQGVLFFFFCMILFSKIFLFEKLFWLPN